MSQHNTAAANRGQPASPSGLPSDDSVWDGTQGLGIYIHFPWCVKKCPYCDFLSLPSSPDDIPHAPYADAIIREISAHAGLADGRKVRSVFFGGGTPSLWEPAQVARVLRAIEAKTELTSDVEITLECNPNSFTAERARAYAASGINRASVGVQSLNGTQLEFLGRWHSKDQALQAIEGAFKAGIPRVSADLIYGVHNQPPEQAVQDVKGILQTGVQHVSAYTLTIEPGTRFGEQQRAGRLPLLEESMVAESFKAVHQTLRDAGFLHYEISNFAQAGYEAQHNLGYWFGEDYLGIGCGAWGTLDGVRYRNPSSPERFMGVQHWPAPRPELEESTRMFSALEPLSPQTRLSERLMLGLRLAQGVNVELLERQLGLEVATPERQKTVRQLTERGRFLVQGKRWRIPTEAWLFADDIISRLL